ncbi:MAG: DUF1385 domain-containing protein [Gemmatimonadota bacterium]|nr:MAG: DUF1385 domain-containing protein [Gemmatimonadota bacterium]
MEKKHDIGGQAVIEGVMMRAPQRIAVAVRKPNGEIALKEEPFVSLSKRMKLFGLPLIRGVVSLIETMVIGVKALTYSADMAVQEEGEHKDGKSSKTFSTAWLVGTVTIALGFGFLLFFYLPLFVTGLFGFESGVLFNVVDGLIRLGVLLLYIWIISMWKEIRRIFEYHGAEHKTIFAYEAGQPLTVASVRAYTTHHPRCGTSFLLIVVVVSILVFLFLGRPDNVGERFLRFLFIPVIGGVSYELIKLSGRKRHSKIGRFFLAPGLWLQRITTKEPSDDQLEVALAALKSALGNA